MNFRIWHIALSLCIANSSLHAQIPDKLILENKHIRAEFQKTDEKCCLSELSRIDGSDPLVVNSKEFEVLLLNDERLTVNDYQLESAYKEKDSSGKSTILTVVYSIRKDLKGPKQVDVIYELGSDSYLRKEIILKSDSAHFIDRLQVLRFSTDQNALGGGHGQPVYINNWFFGIDYPGFYSWHNNNFVEPAFNMRVPYNIDLDNRNKEYAEEEGLVTLYHFPGFSQQINDTHQIRSKRAVIGLGTHKSDNAELAFLEYIEKTRLKPRSFLHYNNWYSIDAKKITIEDFVNKTYLPIKRQFDKYDVKLDAMVPDAGWQDGNFNQPPYRVYKPKLDKDHENLVEISDALQKNGTNLGLWLNFDGRKQHIENAVKNAGYKSAFNDKFDREKYRWTTKDFFDILHPKYQEDLKKSLRFLIQDAKVNYFKHDFNHLFTTNYISERHAREKCLDTVLELLKYERDLNPDIFLNYTNGSWFSPFWLQHVHTLWMMSGDSGGNGDWPQLSLREGATTYRDKYFYDNFRMERADRPVIPIANFMTHGILFSERKPFTDFNDIIDDWSNYVVMYYARGTTVKELYITLELLSESDWEILGKASKWAVENQGNLLRTVYVGGDAGQAEAYGYISWNENKAILTVRNPQREAQSINIPFNHTVYFRAREGESYKAKCIYPFVEEMPWELKSGKEFSIDIPGDCVMVFEIEKGKPKSRNKLEPHPLTKPEVKVSKHGFKIIMNIPDEEFRRLELILENWAEIIPNISINGVKILADRENTGEKWTLSSWDLSPMSGNEITIEGDYSDFEKASVKDKINLNAYLLIDRAVEEELIDTEEMDVPLNIMQGYRRMTECLFKDNRKY